MSKPKRLLQVFKPEHYDLFINVNRQAKRFSGQTKVTGIAKAQTIALHQKDLKIEEVQINHQSAKFTVDNANETFRIKLPQTGQVTLSIKYSAALTDKMMGIYPSYYRINGQEKELIGTQFETNFARQAFPCVDEPAAKATFSLAIKFDEHPGETVISNTPQKQVKDGVHYFKTTKRMSTYLIAFAFGEMQSKITQTKDGIKIGVFATKVHPSRELDFALGIAKHSIEFYEDFYHTKYPLSHSWQLALPDFSAGAMENWGLVTYREKLLLLDPDNASFSKKQLVATVVAHELAHQWFGDLVTMKWWNDLWLNESFANMMEYVATSKIEPQLKIWDRFQIAEVPMALHRDAIDGVQPIHVNVDKPADINSIFDPAIVYAKGARMLVMVRALIGDDNLRAGLKNYLSAHKYGNAQGDDLWDALSQASGMPVGKIMKPWLTQPGYPVVSAKIVNGQLTLKQQQFFIGKGNDVGRKWQIPLRSNYSQAPKIMANRQLNLGDYSKLRKANGKPFQLNCDNRSHFIVKYDSTLLNDLLNHLDALDSVTQMQILQDFSLLAEGRQISFAKIIPELTKFKDNRSAIVNLALNHLISQIKRFVKPQSHSEDQFKHFLNSLIANQANQLGWLKHSNENGETQITRSVVMKSALQAENSNAIHTAHQLFTKHQAEPGSLPASVRGLILNSEMKHYGTPQLFKQLLSAYQQTNDPSYQTDLQTAITSTRDPKIVKSIINQFKNANVIKPQDLRSWYGGLLANHAGQQAVWDWFRDHWQWLEKKLGGDMEFTFYITIAANVFHTQKRLAEFKAFFEPKVNLPGLGREIQMDIESITSRVSLIEAEQHDVERTLDSIQKK